MKKLTMLVLMLSLVFNTMAQKAAVTSKLSRPKAVIGIVIDQGRWDYLYRFYDLYTESGFKRLLKGGYACQNTHVNYLPSLTAPGHTGIYTGSVPSIHGIAGNSYIENSDMLTHEATEDKTVNLIGSEKKGSASPRNMLVSTITDELRLHTNKKSRVFSISLKDRGAIFPGGHLANAAYWYNPKLGFTTSTYYMNTLPTWLVNFNNQHNNEELIKYGWHLSGNDYSLSTPDNTPYEEPFPKEKEPIFPHCASEDRDMSDGFEMTPFANTYVSMMVRACIEGEKIGMTGNTDFLAISYSSPDILGHKMGFDCVEMQDMFLRLDKEIATMLSYLDGKYGSGNYLLFLTADHGGSHNQQFMKDLEMPAGVFSKSAVSELNSYLKGKYGRDSLVIGFTNYYHFFFNNTIFNEGSISRPAVRQSVIDWCLQRPEVAYAFDLTNISNANMPTRIKEMAMNGYNRRRGGDVQIVLNTSWYEYAGKTKGNTHGTWTTDDTHIPLIFYGWNIKPGETTVEYHTTDIAVTIAELLHIQMPNGSIGTPVQFK